MLLVPQARFDRPRRLGLEPVLDRAFGEQGGGSGGKTREDGQEHRATDAGLPQSACA
jgi:hypothetical protein